MTKRSIGILGGGVSGVALAAHLGDDLQLVEKRVRLGGLSGSIIDQGFTFDAAGPHIMFSKNKEVLAHMVEVLGDNVHQRRRENRIWFKGRLVKYPFENDLAALPKEDNFECILGYLQNPHAGDEPHNLALEFVSPTPKPPMEDVLRSAIGIATEGYLHQLYFYYPIEGGYESLVHA